MKRSAIQVILALFAAFLLLVSSHITAKPSPGFACKMSALRFRAFYRGGIAHVLKKVPRLYHRRWFFPALPPWWRGESLNP